jgi:hypothetical protein
MLSEDHIFISVLSFVEDVLHCQLVSAGLCSDNEVILVEGWNPPWLVNSSHERIFRCTLDMDIWVVFVLVLVGLTD